MNIAFFPFTYISPDLFNILESFFGSITVYHHLSGIVPETLQPLQQDHRLQIRIPVSGHEADLIRRLKEYHKWAENPAFIENKFSKFKTGSAPIPGETHAFKIRDEILNRLAEKDPAPVSDPLFTARLFLALAHEYDHRHIDIKNDLAQFKKKEDNLFNALRGETLPGNTSEETIPLNADAPESVMIAERLHAWSRLLLKDDPLPEIYVTTSKEAFQTTTDDTPGAEILPGFDAVSFPLPPVGKKPETSNPLMSYLKTVASSTWSSEDPIKYQIFHTPAAPHATLTLAVFPDTSPREIFTRYLKQTVLMAGKRASNRNTLMALVEL
jgi:hypothetical protein